MADEPAQPKPPYLPWTSFQNITDELRGKGLPGQLDRSAIQGKSGSTQAHYLAALRFLGLIDADDRPTERFKLYVANTDERESRMGMMLREKYSEALALGTSSTSAQLSQVFRESYGLDGETGRKAIAFFLNAARFANIEVSSYWPQTRPGGGGRRRTNGATRKKASGPRGKATDEPLDTPPAAASDPKQRYIDLLLKKADAVDGDLDTELLDRIERVLGLGVDSSPPSAPTHGRSADLGGGGESD